MMKGFACCLLTLMRAGAGGSVLPAAVGKLEALQARVVGGGMDGSGCLPVPVLASCMLRAGSALRCVLRRQCRPAGCMVKWGLLLPTPGRLHLLPSASCLASLHLPH